MMRNRRRLAVLGLLAGMAAFAPVNVFAGEDGKPGDAAPAAEKPKDDRPVSGDDAAKQAIDRFERDFKARDLGRKMAAIQSLATTKNDLVTKRLGKLLAHPEVDVRSGVALLLADMYQNETLAGETLRRLVDSKEDDTDVLCSALLSLGRLNYTAAIPEMGELCKKAGNVFVKIEALKSFGKMKDKRALIPIFDLWLVNPQGYSWEGGEVSYDSGAAGDADQKEAERQYKEKYGNQQRKGAPPTMLKTYIQAIAEAVEKITGEKLDKPKALMEWMCKHEAELPYKLPSKVKQALKDAQEKEAKKQKDKK